MKLSNQNIGQIIKALRLKHGKTLREIAAFLEIDQAILSKMENGKRPISEKLIQLLATYFMEDGVELRKLFVVDKLYKIIEEENDPSDILALLESRVLYQAKIEREHVSVVNQLKDYFSASPMVEEVSWFGSFARGTHSKKSDLDLLIRFSPKNGISMMQFLKMQHELSELVGRKVDLIEDGQLKESARVNVLQEKEIIYVKNKRFAKDK
jgi:predicted nucleotidyltransferase/plasmid maintenance system antidote protein VapI